MEGGRHSHRRGAGRPNRRARVLPIAMVLALLATLALLAGCGGLGTPAAGAGDRAGGAGDAGGGAQGSPAQGSSEVDGVILTADKDRYRPGDPITLTVRNDTAAEIQLTGGLGGLKAWRVDGGQRRPWEHGMVETGALVPVPAGQSAQLGPIPAPEEPGQYLLEIHFYHQGGGPAAASITVVVE